MNTNPLPLFDFSGGPLFDTPQLKKVKKGKTSSNETNFNINNIHLGFLKPPTSSTPQPRPLPIASSTPTSIPSIFPASPLDIKQEDEEDQYSPLPISAPSSPLEFISLSPNNNYKEDVSLKETPPLTTTKSSHEKPQSHSWLLSDIVCGKRLPKIIQEAQAGGYNLRHPRRKKPVRKTKPLYIWFNYFQKENPNQQKLAFYTDLQRGGKRKLDLQGRGSTVLPTHISQRQLPFVRKSLLDRFAIESVIYNEKTITL